MELGRGYRLPSRHERDRPRGRNPGTFMGRAHPALTRHNRMGATRSTVHGAGAWVRESRLQRDGAGFESLTLHHGLLMGFTGTPMIRWHD